MKNLLKRSAAAAFAVLIAAALALPVFAENADVTVYVTIANGALCAACEPVNVVDLDADGVFTVDEALRAAHDKLYEGGADAGYASEATDYGLSLSKLWGVENGGGYGYYVDNASAMSLSDPVADGDHVVAFVYTDTEAFSDTYSFFDAAMLETSEGTVTLTLSAAGYDANWSPITTPVAGAVITVDGERTDVKTDENGSATVNVGKGRHIVSAVSDGETLVPPVCVVDVKTAPQTGSDAALLLVIASCAMAAAIVSGREIKR